MTSIRSISAIAFLALAAPMVARAELAPADSADTNQSIAVKSVGALHVVFREHQGSYWTIAPTVDLVREYMDRLNEPGPLFVRYIQAAGTANQQTFRIEVGFFTEREPEVAHPFQYAERVAETVAFMRVPPSHAAPSRSLPRLRAWALARGYDVHGALTEIHALTGRGANARDMVEVQLVISEPRATVNPTVTPAANTSVEHKGDTTDRSEPVVSVATRDVPTQEVATREDVIKELAQPATVNAAPSVSPMSAIVGQAEEAAERAITKNPLTQPQPAISQSKSMAELAGEGRYDRVAALLLPVGQELSTEESLWLGQILGRVGAAARGLERVYPGQEEEVVKLADALDQRYRESPGYALRTPPKQAVSVARPHSDPAAKHRLAITRDLDHLLGRIAWQSGTADEVHSSLIDILVRVKNELAGDDKVEPDNQH